MFKQSQGFIIVSFNAIGCLIQVYTGPDDLMTNQARKLYDLVVTRFSENEEKLLKDMLTLGVGKG